MRRLVRGRSVALVLGLLTACNGGSPATPDANGAAVSTDHCTYEPMPATANATGTVTAGALSAGAAEAVIAAPVGSALGGYSARAAFLGASTKTVDNRKVPISGTFYPSIGVETAPRAKALALTAGGETVVIVHLDAIFVYEGLVFDLEERLGAAYHGKVLVAASHSHSAWSQFTGHDALQVGAGRLRDVVYQAERSPPRSARRRTRWPRGAPRRSGSSPTPTSIRPIRSRTSAATRMTRCPAATGRTSSST